ncbi:11388_t:CDS:2, partial [Gigaspora rosea]
EKSEWKLKDGRPIADILNTKTADAMNTIYEECYLVDIKRKVYEIVNMEPSIFEGEIKSIIGTIEEEGEIKSIIDTIDEE